MKIDDFFAKPLEIEPERDDGENFQENRPAPEDEIDDDVIDLDDEDGPSQALPLQEVNGKPAKKEETAPKWHKHNTANKVEWVGFLRSEESDKQRRFKAKCQSCGLVMTGIPSRLAKHKKVCLSMAEETRKLVTPVEQLPPEPFREQNLFECIARKKSKQERSDYFLGMFFLTADIDFR